MRMLTILLNILRSAFRSRAAVELENFALRHQLNVLKRSVKQRPKLMPTDRLLWVVLSRVWGDWRSALAIVQPETVIAWHRKGFRLFWTWKVRRGQPGRPAVSREVRDLIRRMSRENPLWGALHIHGELLKLGIAISETSVAKYMVRHRKPPSQTWRTFLNNHVETLVSVDFFTVSTIRFRCFTCFWCWLMNGAAWSTLTSPRIPRRNGPGSSCVRHFHSIRSPDICCAIATRSSAMTSADKSRT